MEARHTSSRVYAPIAARGRRIFSSTGRTMPPHPQSPNGRRMLGVGQCAATVQVAWKSMGSFILKSFGTDSIWVDSRRHQNEGCKVEFKLLCVELLKMVSIPANSLCRLSDQNVSSHNQKGTNKQVADRSHPKCIVYNILFATPLAVGRKREQLECDNVVATLMQVIFHSNGRKYSAQLDCH